MREARRPWFAPHLGWRGDEHTFSRRIHPFGGLLIRRPYEQEGEDADQSFTVTGGCDNTTRYPGVQGNTNNGNPASCRSCGAFMALPLRKASRAASGNRSVSAANKRPRLRKEEARTVGPGGGRGRPGRGQPPGSGDGQSGKAWEHLYEGQRHIGRFASSSASYRQSSVSPSKSVNAAP